MSATFGPAAPASAIHHPFASRAAIALALAVGAAAGVVVGLQAPPASDVELVNLLRAMAVLKLAFVAAAAGAITWRLQAPVRPAWLTAYAATCTAMTAGPGLIWFSSHVILAAILLHAGLAAAILLLWRDWATTDLLRTKVARARAPAVQAVKSKPNPYGSLACKPSAKREALRIEVP